MPLSFESRIKTFKLAGHMVRQVIEAKLPDDLTLAQKELYKEIQNSSIRNPWFIKKNVVAAFREISEMLMSEGLNEWLSNYSSDSFEPSTPKTVAVIMAGNIPFVGFHDMMCVLLAGHRFLGKLSSQDKYLPVCFANILCEIDSSFTDQIEFSEGTISGFDAVIATGSNNSARYFEYYFGRYPNIIRRNRNSAAILTGGETQHDLEQLATDVFLYFGMGCRNVSLIMVPEGYDFHQLFQAFEKFDYLKDMHKYFNNYEYQKAILLVNRINHLDNGFVLLKNDFNLSSPIAVLHYWPYNSPGQVKDYLKTRIDQIQCIVAKEGKNFTDYPCVLPGRAQKPEPNDYADGLDTLQFLISL